MKVIDVHTHPERFSSDGREYSITEAAALMIAHMDDFDCSMSGLLGYDVSPGQDEEAVKIVNSHTASLLSERPDRFFGLVFINPNNSPGSIKRELDWRLSDPGFRGIKLEIDMNCRESNLDYLMHAAIRYDVPILHHSWYINTWCMSPEEREFQKNRSEPHDIADLARRFPDAKIIMAHLEGCGIQGVIDVADLENVWIDTSGAQPFTGTLEFAVRTIGSQRILFGSDMLGRGLASQLGRIIGSTITEKERDQILFSNANALFSLDCGEIAKK